VSSAAPPSASAAAKVRHADRPQQQAEQADRGPDAGADQREQPLCPGKTLRPRAVRMRHRQPGQEGRGNPEIVEPLIHGEGLEIALKRDEFAL